MPSSPIGVANYELSPNSVGDMLEWLISANRPAMVWGPPGVGKSEVAQNIAKKLNMIYLDFRAILFEPIDIKGIPSVKDDTTTWNIPDFLPPSDSDEKYLIVIEELPAAPHSVQIALYQLILDRRIHQYTLPKNAYIMACGNKQSDRGQWNRLPAALASRLIHIDVKVEVDDWLMWAVDNDVSMEVMYFLRYRPELLHQYDPKKNNEFAFPCPRTWKFVDDMFKSSSPVTSELEFAGYRGTVGEGAAVEFTGFLQVCRQLPRPETIINDPVNAEVPTDPQVMIATCGSLYRMADEFNFDSILTYADRVREEIGTYLVSSCVRFNPDLQYTSGYNKWLIKKGGQR